MAKDRPPSAPKQQKEKSQQQASAAVAAKFQQALAFQTQGQLAQAEALYREIIATVPAHFDALHLMGVIAQQRKQSAAAVELIGRAIGIDPNVAAAHANLGIALNELGRHEEALASYERALQLKPAYAEAMNNRGVALNALNRHEEALASYERALQLKPAYAEAMNNRGVTLNSLDRREEALASYERALQLKPDYAEALNNRGNALDGLDRHEEALTSFERALRLKPDYAEALNNRGIALNDLDRREEALASYERALRLKPDYAEALNNRGIALNDLDRHEEALASCERALRLKPDYAEALDNRGIALNGLGRHEEALASCERALRLKPDYAEALNNRGIALYALNRHEEALASYERALRLRPDYAEAHWNESFCRLLIGDFEIGWQKYEWRWRRRDAEKKRYDFAAWDGDASRPRRLLLWAEQGVGDEILYAGMVPELASTPLGITLEVDPRLAPLFRRSFPGVAVIPRRAPAAASPAAHDCQAPLGSLGRWLRPSFNAFPRHDGYLKADGERVAQFSARLRGPGREKVVGISWYSANREFGAHKSSTLLDWAGLLRVPGARFVDLQYGDTAGAREELRHRHGLEITHLDEVDLFNDLEALAALCAACDLVVTVSNATAHMAGALGRPVWLLVPKAYGRIWYWFCGRDDSPWYPSMRIFAQQAPGGWREILESVTRELDASIANE